MARHCRCAVLVQELKERHREVMQELLMDVLRALATPNMDIRKKTLDIALDLITARNIDEVLTRTLPFALTAFHIPHFHTPHHFHISTWFPHFHNWFPRFPQFSLSTSAQIAS